MALTLGDFIGFEGTGALYEVSRGTGGSPAIVTSPYRTGARAVELQDSDYIDFYPSLVTVAGNDFILGFGIQFASVTPSAAAQFLSIANWSENNPVLRLRLETDNKIGLYDEGDSKVGTSTLAVSAGTWYFFELVFQHSTSGNADLYVNDVSWIGVSAQDFSGGYVFDESNGNYRFRGPTGEGITIYLDDIYMLDGASGVSDRLTSGARVLGPYQNTAEDDLDQGTQLDQGTWALTGDTPGVDDGTPAGYTGGASDGHTICDEGSRPGPAGDGADDIQGAKFLHRMSRGNGGGTVHQMRYGHNGDTTTATVSLSGSPANFFALLEASAAQCPTSSEYCAQGGTKDGGGRELYILDMWGFVLDVEAAAPDVFPPVPGRVHRDRRRQLIKM